MLADHDLREFAIEQVVDEMSDLKNWRVQGVEIFCVVNRQTDTRATDILITHSPASA